MPRDAELMGLSDEELLQHGIDLYNAGRYWKAHESWEAVWLEAPQELRLFYQGLIQITAAFVHLTRDEYPGSVNLLGYGIAKLEGYPDAFMGVELGPLLAGARAARERVVALGEQHVADFDRTLIPPIRRSEAASPSAT